MSQTSFNKCILLLSNLEQHSHLINRLIAKLWPQLKSRHKIKWQRPGWLGLNTGQNSIETAHHSVLKPIQTSAGGGQREKKIPMPVFLALIINEQKHYSTNTFDFGLESVTKNTPSKSFEALIFFLPPHLPLIFLSPPFLMSFELLKRHFEDMS